VEDAGPLVHGVRLNSSRDPDAYSKIIYGKGAVGIPYAARHAASSRFRRIPHDTLYRGVAQLDGVASLSAHFRTEDLQKAVERVIVRPEWTSKAGTVAWIGSSSNSVRSTGVPAYELEYTVRPGPKGFSRARHVDSEKCFRTILFSAFQFTRAGARRKASAFGPRRHVGRRDFVSVVSAALPKRLLIDPQMTLLCVSPSSSHRPRNSAASNRAFWRIRLVSSQDRGPQS